MTRQILLRAALASALILALSGTPRTGASATLFGGGPFYTGGSPAMATLRSSGFDTIVLWTIHVASNGDLKYNDERIVADGVYIGRSEWPEELATLKEAPTSVSRVEIAVGSWGVQDFEAIRDLIAAHGTGPDSVLYRNFRALKAATGTDAVDFDDESLYEVGSTVEFGTMLADLGYRVTLCPYMKPNFWSAVRAEINRARPGTVDRIYLQVYEGGATNDPAEWNLALGSVVAPGLWVRHGKNCSDGDTPAIVQKRLAGWKASTQISGGFLWYYDDILKCPSGGTAEEYARAVQAGVAGERPRL